jgi:hypothetical protein
LTIYARRDQILCNLFSLTGLVPFMANLSYRVWLDSCCSQC